MAYDLSEGIDAGDLDDLPRFVASAIKNRYFGLGCVLGLGDDRKVRCVPRLPPGIALNYSPLSESLSGCNGTNLPVITSAFHARFQCTLGVTLRASRARERAQVYDGSVSARNLGSLGDSVALSNS